MHDEGSTSKGKTQGGFLSNLLCLKRQKAPQTDPRVSGDGLEQTAATGNKAQRDVDASSRSLSITRLQTTPERSDLRNTLTHLSHRITTSRHPSNASQYTEKFTKPSNADQSTSVASNEGRTDQLQLLPQTIPCTLIISYDDSELGKPQTIPVKWNFPSSFADLQTAARERLSFQGKETTKDSYMKSGRCHLIVNETGKPYSSDNLERELQWSGTVTSMVTSYWSQNLDKKFHLLIHWKYSGLQIQREDNEAYADTIRNALFNKMSLNWEEKRYISKRDLDAIMSDATVAELISEDESLRAYESGGQKYNHSFNRSDFIKKVQLYRCKLLALFVCVKLPLSLLYTITSKGIEDRDLPLDASHCPNPRLGFEWDSLQKIQGGFLAYIFDEDGGMPTCQELGKHTVVPIHWHKDMGQGSFGKVIEVSIESAHHGFLNDRAGFLNDKTERFALKIFFDHGSRTQGDFQNEAQMLGVLATMPHQHIMRHLALWTQEDKFHMLFPLAEQNLRHYLVNTGHPSLEKDNIMWLLYQFKGLADAVRHIHNLTGLGPGMLDQRLSPAHKRGRTGFHHDLKPENILVFVDSHGTSDHQVTGRIWKIADFGSARIGRIISGSGSGHQGQSHFTSNLSHGDTAYSAPDYAQDQKTSRPYDMWSLGCIFLECLLWVFGSGSSLADFATQRMMVPDIHGNEDSAFWYIGDDGIRLKPAVVRRLHELKSECAERGVFKDLVSIVSKLLTIPPGERTDAPKLCNELDAILVQAKVDLLGNPAFYLQKQYSQNRDIVAAPPTSAGDHDRLSIDERHIAPHARYATANTPPHSGLSGGNMSDRRGKQVNALEPFQSSSSPTHGKLPSLPNGFSLSDEMRLSPVQTQTQDLHPASERSRSPSISLTPTPYERNGFSAPANDIIQNVSWQPPYFRHDDHEALRRSNSQGSRHSGRSLSWPP
jgi:serine/threonine protein kinase